MKRKIKLRIEDKKFHYGYFVVYDEPDKPEYASLYTKNWGSMSDVFILYITIYLKGVSSFDEDRVVENLNG